jgi:hypothetical protein
MKGKNKERKSKERKKDRKNASKKDRKTERKKEEEKKKERKIERKTERKKERKKERKIEIIKRNKKLHKQAETNNQTKTKAHAALPTQRHLPLSIGHVNLHLAAVENADSKMRLLAFGWPCYLCCQSDVAIPALHTAIIFCCFDFVILFLHARKEEKAGFLRTSILAMN